MASKGRIEGTVYDEYGCAHPSNVACKRCCVALQIAGNEPLPQEPKIRKIYSSTQLMRRYQELQTTSYFFTEVAKRLPPEPPEGKDV